jgi:hypothetical protein
MPAAESIDKQASPEQGYRGFILISFKLELGDPTVAVASTQDEGMNDGQADSAWIINRIQLYTSAILNNRLRHTHTCCGHHQVPGSG